MPYADRERFQQATRTMFTLHATPEQVLAARQEIRTASAELDRTG
ncbi:hypothetical protein ACIBQ1_56785 [Nonomuraea sp. NPDC050153]